MTHMQGGWRTTVFNLFGHPTPYAYVGLYFAKGASKQPHVSLQNFSYLSELSKDLQSAGELCESEESSEGPPSKPETELMKE
jgi:hypothetical protein